MTYQEALHYLSNILSSPQAAELTELLMQKQWEQARYLFIELGLDSEVFDVILAHEQRCQNSVVAFVEIDVNNLPQDSEGKRFLFRRGLDVFQSSIIQFRSFNGPKVYYNSLMLDLDVIDQAWEIVEI